MGRLVFDSALKIYQALNLIVDLSSPSRSDARQDQELSKCVTRALRDKVLCQFSICWLGLEVKACHCFMCTACSPSLSVHTVVRLSLIYNIIRSITQSFSVSLKRGDFVLVSAHFWYQLLEIHCQNMLSCRFVTCISMLVFEELGRVLLHLWLQRALWHSSVKPDVCVQFRYTLFCNCGNHSTSKED